MGEMGALSGVGFRIDAFFWQSYNDTAWCIDLILPYQPVCRRWRRLGGGGRPLPRASRHFLPGCVWHLTHRCHEREFLLKFARDREKYMEWMLESKKRYGLTVLNYIITSNHVHLLVEGGEDEEDIPRSMQLMAGRTAQQYNRRKDRAGAFWEDRYHGTAVESTRHLARCMVYIDLNMVRAGVVSDPGEWEWCGYREIQRMPRRYRRIDRERLAELLGLQCARQLPQWQHEAVARFGESCREREPAWSESLAVGSEGFVREVKQKLGPPARFREVEKCAEMFVLREAPGEYVTSRPRGRAESRIT